jgi:hypothetical protein
MPLFECVLLAVLGSAGAVSPVGAPTRTLTADSVTQPSGAAESFPGQVPGGDPDRPHKGAGTERKSRYHLEAGRHRRSGRRHGKVIKHTTDSGKKATKS